MEPLYPQNILERRYPILRERREREEREAVDESRRLEEGVARLVEGFEVELYQNEPTEAGHLGRRLNTLA